MNETPKINKNYIDHIIRELTPKDRAKYLYGEWAVVKCSVRDNHGNHCPGEAIIFFKDFQLCGQCYKNYINREFKKLDIITIKKMRRLYEKL